jgi:hypothetical protein
MRADGRCRALPRWSRFTRSMRSRPRTQSSDLRASIAARSSATSRNCPASRRSRRCATRRASTRCRSRRRASASRRWGSLDRGRLARRTWQNPARMRARRPRSQSYFPTVATSFCTSGSSGLIFWSFAAIARASSVRRRSSSTIASLKSGCHSSGAIAADRWNSASAFSG